MNNIKAQLPLIALSFLMLLSATTSSYACTGSDVKNKPENAQHEKKRKPPISNLTDTQKKQIKTLRMEYKSKALTQHNIIDEKKAKLKTISMSAKPDIDGMMNLIDEIGSMKTMMKKDKMRMTQNIRALLSDEQRLEYDLHRMHRSRKANHKPHMRSRG